MSEKSELIDKLKNEKKVREAYVRAKIAVNLPSQIRALRLKQEMKQEELAEEAGMKQPRISAMERPGATKFNIETLIRLAAALKVGLIVRFATFSEMLRWENSFSQDAFEVATIDEDIDFQKEEVEQPAAALPASVLSPPKEPIFDFSKELMTPGGTQRQKKEKPNLGGLLAGKSGGGYEIWNTPQ